MINNDKAREMLDYIKKAIEGEPHGGLAYLDFLEDVWPQPARDERLVQPVDAPQQPKHCDDYIMDFDAPDCLRWFLLIERLPAIDKWLAHNVLGGRPPCYATYQGKRVKLIMASRLGDVGITENFNAANGYTNRVGVHELSDFRTEP